MNRKHTSKPAPVGEAEPIPTRGRHIQRVVSGSPEDEAELRFLLEEGCLPYLKEYRDNLIAQGYAR